MEKMSVFNFGYHVESNYFRFRQLYCVNSEGRVALSSVPFVMCMIVAIAVMGIVALLSSSGVIGFVVGVLAGAAGLAYVHQLNRRIFGDLKDRLSYLHSSPLDWVSTLASIQQLDERYLWAQESDVEAGLRYLRARLRDHDVESDGEDLYDNLVRFVFFAHGRLVESTQLHPTAD
ncbi:hypothetical protein [Ferrimonas marina]|uniref:Uncharacterized protein n=1 Tax=Ferrimonas marina TaxID=299255 RepID=A0A1M5TDS9_9GAMM|nr:hypothetical protein [Ferrimonas marina]SHH48937.1 hypothetical protein SAMN02745129_2102 [Ferrimonas marina]